MTQTVLVVDDEDSVRRTFQDWLTGSGLDVQILVAADAESALLHANQQPIDLAILDWNLGSGSDGLQLLEDLSLFHPDVIAILVTGFAHQATPLDALRMGVRDYLDKNQDLNRETFLRAVQRQLDRIIPAKRQRAFNQTLKEFREVVEKILPLVQTTAALNDPVPLPHAIGSLFRFLMRTTGASDGVLLVRHFGDATESCRVYDVAGQLVQTDLIPFAESIAATAVSMQEPCSMVRDDLTQLATQRFEKNRRSLLAAPLSVGPTVHVVLELFDKQTAEAFSEDDRKIASAAADFGSEILRQALAERQNHQLLLDALGSALGATEKLSTAPHPTLMDQPPPAAVMDRLREGLNTAVGPAVDSDATLELAEAVRVLAVRHGSAAVRHCVRMMRSLRELLDSVTEHE